jgi:hypothetical protein
LQHALSIASDRHWPAALFEAHLLKNFKVLLNVGAVEDVAVEVQVPFEFFASTRNLIFRKNIHNKEWCVFQN